MKVTVVWSSLSHVFSFCFNESRKEKVLKLSICKNIKKYKKIKKTYLKQQHKK